MYFFIKSNNTIVYAESRPTGGNFKINMPISLILNTFEFVVNRLRMEEKDAVCTEDLEEVATLVIKNALVG